MPHLRRVAGLCSSKISDPANRLLKRTDSEGSSSAAEKKSSAVPSFRSGHMSAICARLSKGKGRFTRGWKPQVSTLLCPRRVGALPAEVQRKPPRPLGANTLTQFEHPCQPVQKRSRPVRANTLTQFACPSQQVLRKPAARKGRTRLRSSRPPLSRCRETGCRPDWANCLRGLCAPCKIYRRIVSGSRFAERSASHLPR